MTERVSPSMEGDLRIQIWILITQSNENEQQIAIHMQRPLWGFDLMPVDNRILAYELD